MALRLINNPSVENSGLRLKVIGPMQLLSSVGTDVLPRSRRARALIAVVALEPDQSISRRHLASLLWSRVDGAAAMPRLRSLLHALRKTFGTIDGSALITTDEHVAFRNSAVEVDVTELLRSSKLDIAGINRAGADLENLTPALNQWLRRQRNEWRSTMPERSIANGSSRDRRRGATVGIAPLKRIGSLQDQDIAFGITEEIASTLSRVRAITVVTSASLGAFLEAEVQGTTTQSIDFLLSGTIQSLGNNVRFNFHLENHKTQSLVWASSFHYENKDLFALQGEVAQGVAASLELEVPIIEARKTSAEQREAAGAYELVLKAIHPLHEFDEAGFLHAGELLEQAIAIDPEYAAAYTWLAFWNIFLVGQGWSSDPVSSINEARVAAEHAIRLDPNDARGLTIAGHVRAFLDRRIDDALVLHERALAINPSLSLAWTLSGVAHAYAGELAEARRKLERGYSLAPRDPHGFFRDGALLIVELLSGNYEEACALGRRITQLQPRYSAAYKPYLAALGHLNRRAEAARVAAKLASLEPNFATRTFIRNAPYVRKEHLEIYVRGFKLAGLS